MAFIFTHLSSRRLDQLVLFRLLRATGLLLAVFLIGTFGYYYLCDKQYDLLTCAYMTTITLTAVGYGEVIPVMGYPDRIVLTICLAILGLGIMMYFVSTLTAFVVDGDLRDLLHQRRMSRTINKLKNHYIIAGLGSLGIHVLEEMQSSDKTCLVIERNPEMLDQIIEFGVPYIIGDATDDKALLDAGILHAQGLVIALGNERDNLFTTITAKELNPTLRIVTRGDDPASRKKFERAGATSVIYTNVLGGMRMASEVLRPEVTTFLELMMRDHGHVRRIEELPIPSDSPLIGMPLSKTRFRTYTDALIIAIHEKNDDYIFNPGPSYVFEPDTKLIVLTLVSDVPKLKSIIAGEL